MDKKEEKKAEREGEDLRDEYRVREDDSGYIVDRSAGIANFWFKLRTGGM
ncbi:MAG: hypothetical protein KKF56_00885 [Nanoarchaeota archaeon]|nr:hypothetical protein [Nanoarchaeota archaeon]